MQQRPIGISEDRSDVIRDLAETLNEQAYTSAPSAGEFNANAPGSNGIVLIIDGGPLSWGTVNHVIAHYGPVDVIIDPPEPKSVFLKRRVKLLGRAAVAGQLAFAIVQKVIKSRSQKRIGEIISRYRLNPMRSSAARVHEVATVNSKNCREILKKLNPKVVFVHGTRIIKGRTLNCVDAPFINFHAGINPAYRGQHGAYWARANGDEDHAGITIHLIDEGVDTGQVLYQKKINPKRADNICTYQYLQTATALPFVLGAIDDALAGKLAPVTVKLPSKQWFHPTLWGYLYAGLKRGVW